jgi:hypothetical protein
MKIKNYYFKGLATHILLNYETNNGTCVYMCTVIPFLYATWTINNHATSNEATM